MIPLRSDEIKGVWATLLLPIASDDSIEFPVLAEEIELLIAAGVNGVYSNGTAGEFHNQTEAEFDAIHELLAAKCERAAKPFQIGASHPCPATALARVRRAAALRPSAIQVILPDWLPTTPAENVVFLEKLVEAANGIGLVLYNPPHAKRILDAAALAALRAAIPRLVGVKLADGNASWYASLRERVPGLSVFVPGHHMATGVLAGAMGSYSNVGSLSPRATQRWYELIHKDAARALRMEQLILAYFQKHISPLAAAGFSNPALDKSLCFLGGWCPVGTRLRWPYASVPESVLHPLKECAVRELEEFFALEQESAPEDRR